MALSSEYYQWLPGTRSARCRACGTVLRSGQRILTLQIKDTAVPYDQRRQHLHAKCVHDILGSPLPDEDDINKVIAGVRELVQDFS